MQSKMIPSTSHGFVRQQEQNLEIKSFRPRIERRALCEQTHSQQYSERGAHTHLQTIGYENERDVVQVMERRLAEMVEEVESRLR